MSYHRFKDEDGNEYGSFEVFYVPENDLRQELESVRGWYWWPCFPGCMPDCDEPFGPFKDEQSAIKDAL